jgi:2-polyprenyl-6-methoxyphenol hydroxylase-like FAD-dependent oxidoreductase
MFDTKNKDIVSAEYSCLFGISSATQHITDGDVHVNYKVDISTMIIGSKGRVFWFIFKRLDKVYTMPNIPRYTKLDAETFASQHHNRPITPDVCFGDIWEKRTSYTLVATEEAQLKRWSWGRIACIGDSAHKMTPNLGHGGNAAIE